MCQSIISSVMKHIPCTYAHDCSSFHLKAKSCEKCTCPYGYISYEKARHEQASVKCLMLKVKFSFCSVHISAGNMTFPLYQIDVPSTLNTCEPTSEKGGKVSLWVFRMAETDTDRKCYLWALT